MKLTAEDIRQLLDYDPETGVFIWKERNGDPGFNKKYAGKPAGRRDRGSIYDAIHIGGNQSGARRYYCHVLAYLWMTGSWPADQIDHRNGDRWDNRWENLRPATRSENVRNRKIQKNNSNGLKGVIYMPRNKNKKYTARIMVNGKSISLKYHYTAEEAHAAYVEASKKYHGEFSRTE
jgi:hypothetical protein